MLSKGPHLPCVSMADRALLAGYPRYMSPNGVTRPKWVMTYVLSRGKTTRASRVLVVAWCFFSWANWNLAASRSEIIEIIFYGAFSPPDCSHFCSLVFSLVTYCLRLERLQRCPRPHFQWPKFVLPTWPDGLICWWRESSRSTGWRRRTTDPE